MARTSDDQDALTKAELVDRIHDDLGVTRKEARIYVEKVLDTIKDALADDGDPKVKISGFGSFQVRQKAARMGQNPRTLEKIVIGRRRVLVFKPSQVFKASLNKESGQ